MNGTEGELLGLCAMVGLWMLGVSRIRSMIAGLVVQGLLLGGLVLARGIHLGQSAEVLTGLGSLAIKAVAIPAFLHWSANRLGVEWDRGIGFAPGVAMLVGAAAVVACCFNGGYFAAAVDSSPSAGLPIGLVIVGLIMMLTRRTAMGMAVGFLVIDNGIFAYSATQTPGLPAVIELGVLFDVFVGVLLIGLVLFHGDLDGKL